MLASGSSVLQTNMRKIENFTKSNMMRINESKSKVMIFNKSKKYDFQPEFSFSEGGYLECLEEMRLLGVVLSSDLKWGANTKAILRKAMSKMWLIRRLKGAKLDPKTIFEYYSKEIRPLAEHGVVIWNSGLTKSQVMDLEKIQKVALKIILGDKYDGYDSACKKFNIDKLSLRRESLCINFAVKLFKSHKSKEYFELYLKKREGKAKSSRLVREPHCRTTRCYNAPHSYLARLVNSNKKRIEKIKTK